MSSHEVAPDAFESPFMTMKQVAHEMGFSRDTIRRYFIAGKLREIKWADFLQNGSLRATRESVMAFKAKRMEETRKSMGVKVVG
jgi:predicted site-specific integrase-resolvase